MQVLFGKIKTRVFVFLSAPEFLGSVLICDEFCYFGRGKPPKRMGRKECVKSEKENEGQEVFEDIFVFEALCRHVVSLILHL